MTEVSPRDVTAAVAAATATALRRRGRSEEDEDSAAVTGPVLQSAQLARPIREGTWRAAMRHAKSTFEAVKTARRPTEA